MAARVMPAVLGLLLFASLPLTGNAAPHAQRPPQEDRFFEQTGYAIEHDALWRYFQAHGGVATFGYPISRPFRFRGNEVQIFQRHVLEVAGERARPVNLLDPDTFPVARINHATFPAHNPAVAMAAPPPTTPEYGRAVHEYLTATVPNEWEGQPVGFRDYYAGAAAGAGAGAARTMLDALDVWGFPTSRPMRDPNNHAFIYQRFQRGIMHFDASTQVTRGILAGQAFKRVLTGRSLPADLAADMAGSPLLGIYDPDAPSGLARTAGDASHPITRENTDLRHAFEPHVAAPAAVSRVQLFFVAVGDAGRRGPRIGCDDSLVPVTVEIEPSPLPVRAAIEELLIAGERPQPQSDLYNALHRSRLQVQNVLIVEGRASIYLTGEHTLGGVCDTPRFEAQITQTAVQFDHVAEAEIFLNRVPLREALRLDG